MFTGIIQATALKKVTRTADGAQLILKINQANAALFADVSQGESIAVNGVCLTVEKILRPGEFAFFVSSETIARTNPVASQDTAEQTVNLERALQLSDRMSGHLVQGHVDGLALCTHFNESAEAKLLKISIPHALSKYVVEKGSICLDGISLTVNAISDSKNGEAQLDLMIIPHTWQNTHLKHTKPGDHFNVEVDVVAKYVERLIKPQ